MVSNIATCSVSSAPTSYIHCNILKLGRGCSVILSNVGYNVGINTSVMCSNAMNTIFRTKQLKVYNVTLSAFPSGLRSTNGCFSRMCGCVVSGDLFYRAPVCGMGVPCDPTRVEVACRNSRCCASRFCRLSKSVCCRSNRPVPSIYPSSLSHSAITILGDVVSIAPLVASHASVQMFRGCGLSIEGWEMRVLCGGTFSFRRGTFWGLAIVLGTIGGLVGCTLQVAGSTLGRPLLFWNMGLWGYHLNFDILGFIVWRRFSNFLGKRFCGIWGFILVR